MGKSAGKVQNEAQVPNGVQARNAGRAAKNRERSERNEHDIFHGLCNHFIFGDVYIVEIRILLSERLNEDELMHYGVGFCLGN